MKLFLVLCCFYFSIWVQLHSQSLYFEHFDTHKGLPSSEVYAAKQDKQGFMWFATDRGICRYDGKNFRTYTTADGLIGNVALRIWQAKDVLVFVMFNKGFMFLKDGKFYNDRFIDTTVLNFTEGNLEEVMLHPSGNLFFGKKNKIMSLNVFSKTIQKFVIPNSEYEEYLPTETKTPTNRNSYSFYLVNCGENGIFNRPIYSLNKLNQDTVLIWEHGIIIKIKKRDIDNTIRLNSHYVSSNEYILYYTRIKMKVNFRNLHLEVSETTNSNNLKTIISNKHIIKFYKDYITIDDYKLNFFNKNITDITFDKDNNIWIPTLTDGVYKISNYQFLNYLNPRKSQILKLLRYQNRIFAFDMKNGFLCDNKLKNIIEFKENFKSIWINNDSIWLNWAFLFDPKKMQINQIYSNNRLSLSSRYFCFNSKYYIIHRNSMIEAHDKASQKFLRRWKNPEYVTSSLFLNNQYFYSTINGLYHLNFSLPIDQIEHELLKKYHAIFGNRINHITQFNNLLYLSSHGNGIVIYDYINKKVIKNITRKNGLLSNTVNCIFVNIDGNLYCGHTMGVTFVKLDKSLNILDIKIATEKDGFVNAEVNDLLEMNNTLYIATKIGVQMCNLDFLFKKPSFPLLKFTEIKLGESVFYNKENYYSFAHNQNGFIVNFESPYFSYSAIKEFATFKYALLRDGEDTIWNFTNEYFVQFSNLRHGNYQLLLTVANKNGTYNPNLSLMRIVIKPKFSQTIGFFLLCAFLLLISGYFVYRFRIRILKRNQNYESEIQTAQLNTLKAQMNPHFVFNSLNSIQNYIYKNKSKEANEYIVRFSQLMRRSILFSVRDFIKISDELEYIKDYLFLEKKRFEEKISYSVINHLHFNIDEFEMPPLMVQPSIENSIKHAFKGNIEQPHIQVIFQPCKYEGYIEVIVQDNGVGLDFSDAASDIGENKSTGIGIENLKKRIDIINSKSIDKKANIVIENCSDQSGTRAILILPIIDIWV